MIKYIIPLTLVLYFYKDSMTSTTKALDIYVKLNSVCPFLAETYRKDLSRKRKPQIPLNLNLNKIKLGKKSNSCFEKEYRPKTVTTKGKMIGVEIECFIPTRCFSILGDSDYDVDDYAYCKKLAKLFDALNMKGVSVSEDGSLYSSTNKNFGAEIQVLFNINNPEVLQKTLEILHMLGATVNRSCGLHVHVDTRNLPMAKHRKHKIKNLIKLLPVMGSLVPSYRCDGEYSSIYCTSTYNEQKDAAITLNNRLQTIEFRLHQGSLDYARIIAWVNFCHALTHNRNIKPTSFGYTIEEVLEIIKLDKADEKALLKTYSKSMYQKICKRLLDYYEDEDSLNDL